MKIQSSLVLGSLLLVAPRVFAQPAPAPGVPPVAPPVAPAPVAPPPGPAVPPAAAPAPVDPVPAAPAPDAPPIPPTDAPPALAVAPLAEATPPAEGAAEPAPPDRLGVGKSDGFFQPGLLLQFWFLLRNVDGETANTFRLRRAEIRAKGELVPKALAYNVMIDPARSLEFEDEEVEVTGQEPEPTAPGSVEVAQPSGATSIFQDFFITFLTDYADVSLGQFKNPVSLEGYGSSSKIVMPERAAVSRAFGDRRDIGVRIDKKLGDQFYYHLGVFNGDGQNRLDSDDDKDAALRLEVYPIEGLTLAALGYATVGEREGATRDRLEADARYDANDMLAQAEYIRGWNGDGDATVEGHGGYLLLGYTFFDRLQPVVRLGALDSDVDVADTTTVYYEGGVNGWLHGREAKLGLSVTVADPDVGPTSTEAILAAQLSY